MPRPAVKTWYNTRFFGASMPRVKKLGYFQQRNITQNEWAISVCASADGLVFNSKPSKKVSKKNKHKQVNKSK